MKKIIHKADYKRKFSKYIGLGQYEEIPSTLCVGPKGVWAGNSYLVHRLWKNVTCKHCLKKRDNK